MINVSFSGSGFLFPFHIGALKALEDNNIQIDAFSGTSGGAVVASFACCGYSAREMEQIVYGLDFRKFLDFSILSLLKSSLCKGKFVDNFLKDHIGEETRFSSILPLFVTATDTSKHKPKIFSSKTNNVPVWEAVRASISMPFIFPPVKIEESTYIDGFYTNNAPFLAFDSTKFFNNNTLGIQLTARTIQKFAGNMKFSATTAMSLLALLIDNMDRLHLRISEMSDNTNVIFIDKQGLVSLDTDISESDIASMIESGYYYCSEEIQSNMDFFRE